MMSALLLVYVFNFIDRSIINILTEPKKAFGLKTGEQGFWAGRCPILYTAVFCALLNALTASGSLPALSP